MSRHDKLGAAVLGLLLFCGLFYFIYTTMKNPLPSEFGDEELLGETLDDEELDEELAAEEDDAAVPAEGDAAPETPAAPAPK
jgi:hypothetical protein